MSQLIGHRGGRHLWPENSLLGFREVLNLPVDAVELDLHLTRSGEVAVMHDPLLERTSDGLGEVRDLTPEARRALRLRGPDGALTDEGLPLLSEVLEIFAPAGMELQLEIKGDAHGGQYEGLAEAILAEVDRLYARDRVVLTSFDLDVLAHCKAVAPETRRLLSMSRGSAVLLAGWLGLAATDLDGVLEAALGLADFIAVQEDFFASEFEAITAKVPMEKLGAWVINTPEALERWLAIGPGLITSDDPALACAIRDGAR